MPIQLGELGKHAEAAEQHRAVQQLRAKVLGPEHPDTLSSMNNYAYQLGKLGKHAEAAEQHKAVQQLHAKVLGPEHPDTLSSMNNYAIQLGDSASMQRPPSSTERSSSCMPRCWGQSTQTR